MCLTVIPASGNRRQQNWKLLKSSDMNLPRILIVSVKDSLVISLILTKYMRK